MRILEALYDGKGEPMIAYNGGLVIESDGSIVHDVPILAEDVVTILEACEELGLHGSVYARDDWYIWAEDRWSAREINNTGVQPHPEFARWYLENGLQTQNPPHKIQCMGDASAIAEIQLRLSSNDQLITYRSKDTYLEICNSGCSKGDAVEAIIRERGIEPHETYYFGDNYNDISAFSVVGTSIAVANSKPEVLAAATSTTARHHDDGVARFLEAWLTS